MLCSHLRRIAQNSAGLPFENQTYILSVYCGPGTITAPLMHLVPERVVTGVDGDDAKLDVLVKARQRLRKRL